MKKYIALLLILFAPILNAKAQITVSNDTTDCGETMYADSIAAKFNMTNNGIRPLQIIKVVASCGCTKVDYPYMPIMPKRDFSIVMTYDGMQLGHYAKWVDVYVEDYETPFRLTMKGTIKSPRQPFKGRKRFMKNYDKY